MSVLAVATVPRSVLASRRRVGGRLETSYRYIYDLTGTGDATGGTITLSIIPPQTLVQRNRLTMMAALYTDDTTAVNTRFRVICGAGGSSIIYTVQTLAPGTGSDWLPRDIPRNLVLPDGAPALEFEWQRSNVLSATSICRLDLLVEPFEQS